MSKLYGLIPAAGKGTRAHPYSTVVPKSMLYIDNEPNIVRNITIMRDDIGINDIVIVVGHLGDVIKEYLGDGAKQNINIKYVDNLEIDKGLAYSIMLGNKYIDDYCVVMLSDECYVNSNHKAIKEFPYKEAIATCATISVDDVDLIKKNYSVELEGNKITKLVEKPKIVTNDILGCGTFILHPDIFTHLEREYKEKKKDYVEFISFIGELCQKGEKVFSFNLKGDYVNINDRDSLSIAKYHSRSKDFDKRVISLLMYCEGDEQNIEFAVKRYKSLSFINNFYLIVPHESFVEKVFDHLDVKLIQCPPNITGYGEKQKYALEKAEGDILVLCDADYSFPYRDILKLLAYLREADMVIGTRTTRQLIEQGSNMKGMVRFANVMLAKIIEYLWWSFEGRFTDAQCIFRAIWKSYFNNIKDNLKCKTGAFGTEMIIEILNDRGKIIEIPVNYNNRPQSAYRKYQNINLFFEILLLILKKKVQQIIKNFKN
jgi:dTDP-glucose pyrophosphorylase